MFSQVIDNNNYSFGISTFIYIFAFLVNLFLGYYLFRLKEKSARNIAILNTMLCIWSIGAIFEIGAKTIPLKIFWSVICYLGIPFVAPAFFIFVLSFTEQDKNIKSKNLLWLYLFPAITFLVAATNSYHHALWRYVSLPANSTIAIYHPGWFLWIFWAYCYLLIPVGTILLISHVINVRSTYKKQIVWLFIAAIFPITGNMVYMLGLNPIPGFDWTLLGFSIACLILAIEVIELKLFHLMPFVRNTLFDALNEGILVINSQYSIIDINSSLCATLELKPKKILGKKIFDFFPELETRFKEFIHPGPSQTDYSLKKGNGTYFFSAKIIPVLDLSKSQNGFIILFQNITEIRESAIKLEALNTDLKKQIEEKQILINDLEAFSHTVAHDIQNLIGGTLSGCDILRMQLPDTDPMTNKVINMMEKSGTKAISVMHELLLLAQIQQQDIVKGNVDMSLIVNNVEERLQYAISKKKAKIQKPDYWPAIQSYGPWIEEIWLNLISNGIKYGGEPPIITIGYDILPEQKIKFWVKDNGNGLSQEQIDLLFRKEIQYHKQTSEGTGLGISIVKRIIKKLNGYFYVESPHIQGQGSVFFFTLPT